MSDSIGIEKFESSGAQQWLAGLEEGEMSPSRIAAVMVLGALGSLALYYIYSTLSPETREGLKDQALRAIKQGVGKYTQV